MNVNSFTLDGPTYKTADPEGCAVGDEVSFTVKGKVTAVSEEGLTVQVMDAEKEEPIEKASEPAEEPMDEGMSPAAKAVMGGKY